MLLAIANAPEQRFFESVVADLLERDFGGTNGLYELEQQCRSVVEKKFGAQYRLGFNRWFTTPLVGLTAVLYILLFKMPVVSEMLGSVLLLLIGILIISPGVLTAIRGFSIGYKHALMKASMKDQVFKKISYRPNRLLFALLCTVQVFSLLKKYAFNVSPWLFDNPIILKIVYLTATTILVLMTIHIMLLITMMLVEIKKGIITIKS